MQARALWLGLALLLGVSRWAFLDVVWIEEAYPTAAARELLHGATLYRDVWFDKPPLFPYLYLLWGAHTGWPLRLAGVMYVLLSCWVVGRAARHFFGEPAGMWAAGLLGFYWTFGVHAALLALTPDLLMLPWHVGAVLLAAMGSPFVAGVVCGVALLFNGKALFVLAACLLWQWRAAHRLLVGFAFPVAAAAMVFPARELWEQVWVWGAGYSQDSPFGPGEGLRRTMNWLGFHAALLIPSCASFRRNWRLAAWAAVSLTAVLLGARYFPRYYFHLLPVLVLAAAGGLAAMPRRWRPACLLLLLIPFVRFGPRYIQMMRGEPWRDLAMFESSRQAAAQLQGGTLFVWGYRPDIYVLSGLPAGTRFLDSQPLTGVLADRHLTGSRPTFAEWAARNRRDLVRTAPDWIVDGLGPYNPALDIRRVPDLAEWLAHYDWVTEVPGVRIARRKQ